MKLHAKSSKFHIKAHSKRSNGSTHTLQVIATICPKQQLGILQASKQYATASQREDKRQIQPSKTATASTLLHELDALTTRLTKIYGLHHCYYGMM